MHACDVKGRFVGKRRDIRCESVREFGFKSSLDWGKDWVSHDQMTRQEIREKREENVGLLFKL